MMTHKQPHRTELKRKNSTKARRKVCRTTKFSPFSTSDVDIVSGEDFFIAAINETNEIYCSRQRLRRPWVSESFLSGFSDGGLKLMLMRKALRMEVFQLSAVSVGRELCE